MPGRGGELFGFDRSKAISFNSAEHIAQAAQAFGQKDDITVLRITRHAAVKGAMPEFKPVLTPAPA